MGAIDSACHAYKENFNAYFEQIMEIHTLKKQIYISENKE